jgi:hypothetical protein
LQINNAATRFTQQGPQLCGIQRTQQLTGSQSSATPGKPDAARAGCSKGIPPML